MRSMRAMAERRVRAMRLMKVFLFCPFLEDFADLRSNFRFLSLIDKNITSLEVQSWVRSKLRSASQIKLNLC